MIRGMLFGLLVIGGFSCEAPQVDSSPNNEFSIKELGQNTELGQVSALGDVYKTAFEAAQKTITYENASAHLDQLELQLKQELQEVIQ